MTKNIQSVTPVVYTTTAKIYGNHATAASQNNAITWIPLCSQNHRIPVSENHRERFPMKESVQSCMETTMTPLPPQTDNNFDLSLLIPAKEIRETYKKLR